jgi:glutathione S-transferase
MAGTLHHLALADEWAAAVAAGEAYRRSTIGRSLDEEGFIHCSFPHQVAATAERYYGRRTDVVVLEIDATKVAHLLRVEDLTGSGELFPHLYGPLPLDAVVAVREHPRDQSRNLPT